MESVIRILRKEWPQLIVLNVVIFILSLLNHNWYILIIVLLLYSYIRLEHYAWIAAGAITNLIIVYLESRSILFTLLILLSSGISIALVSIVYRSKIEKKVGKINNIIKKILDIKYNISSKNGDGSLKDEKTSVFETSSHIIGILKKYYDFDYISIFIKNSRGFSLTASDANQTRKDELELAAKEFIERIQSDNSSGLILESDGKDVLEYPSARQRGIRYSCIVPLGDPGNFNGILLLENKEKVTFLVTKKEQEMFDTLTESISLVLQYIIYESRILSTALVDGLTGLYNRTYLKIRFKDELERHHMQNSPFCICVMDIDHFKKFNDTYGHLFGDLVLRSVSTYIKEHIREEDIPTRFGGEEMLILFPCGMIDDIYQRVEQLRDGISKLVISDKEGTSSSVTASFGISQYPIHGKTIDELIEHADNAVYISKKTGRNKVTKYQVEEK